MALHSCRNQDYYSRLSPITSTRDEDSSMERVKREPNNCNLGDSSGSSSSSSTHDVVTETLRDVISLQHSAMRKIRDDAEKQKLDYVLKVTYDDMVRQFNDEKLEHEKSRLHLQKEQEKLQFALGEIEILKQHLQREKHEHDELIKSSHHRVSRESKRSDFLHHQCTQNEGTIQALRDELKLKDNEIVSLKQRLKFQKEAHKNLLDDIELQRVQQEYMSRSLNKEKKK